MPMRARAIISASWSSGRQCVRRWLGLRQIFGAGHHDVNVDVGARVFFVREVEHARAADEAHARRSNRINERIFGKSFEFHQRLDRDSECDVSTGNGCGAGAAVGLQDIAINDDAALAECRHIYD